MECSPLPIRKWFYAIYLDCTSLKGVSSMKLHRDLGVTQKTAWFMQQRIREAFASEGPVFMGPDDLFEVYFIQPHPSHRIWASLPGGSR